MTNRADPPSKYKQSAEWLRDAPLFVDADLVNRFFDAVVLPPNRPGSMTVTIGSEDAVKLTGNLRGEAGLETAGWWSWIGKGTAKVGGEAGRESELVDTHEKVQVYEHISTPQRQLLDLFVYFYAERKERLHIVTDASDESWRKPAALCEPPRAMVFLDLPGNKSPGYAGGGPKLIPTAAEFENGTVEAIFPTLLDHAGQHPPPYRESGSTAEEIEKQDREYWGWFAKSFSPLRATKSVEAAASKNGRVRWIDYRLPLNGQHETLHIHMNAAGQYDNGLFAYQLIKRGYEYGLRIVGTLKSGPALNVLAIYER